MMIILPSCHLVIRLINMKCHMIQNDINNILSMCIEGKVDFDVNKSHPTWLGGPESPVCECCAHVHSVRRFQRAYARSVVWEVISVFSHSRYQVQFLTSM